MESPIHPWSIGKTVVFFSAPWCAHCKQMSNAWQNFAKALKVQHPDVKAFKINTDRYDTSSVHPQVFGFPTIRAYKDGQQVSEFDSERTQHALLQFARTHLVSPASQMAGKRRRRTRTRARSSNRRQRGGGSLSANAAPVMSAIGTPVDVPSKVSSGQQWSGPYDRAPDSPRNGGLYTGPPGAGPHASLPVTPTTGNYIHHNLLSASGTPQSTTQYPNTNRPGNNFSDMPGVSNFAKQGTGPHRIHCTGDASPVVGGKGLRRRRRHRHRRRVSTRRHLSRRIGGLNLRAANLDDGSPFHPEWSLSEGGTQNAGRRRSRKGKRRTSAKRQAHAYGGGKLNLRTANMDDGAPFHPEWQ